jgi:hypothetical protein
MMRLIRETIRANHMRLPFRSKQELRINAPLETVWEFNMDIMKIPSFHPRVVKVELLSGKGCREPGVAYKCHFSDGKDTCVEKDLEIVPMQKLVPVLPEDTFGINKVCLTAWSKRRCIVLGSVLRRSGSAITTPHRS